jgi:hypothetical protein
MRELAFAVLIAFASYRVWAFIALDTITKPLRLRVLKDDSWLKIWWKCPWCAGTWITAAITILVVLLVDGGIGAPVLVGVAAAAGTAILGGNDDRLMDSDE